MKNITIIFLMLFHLVSCQENKNEKSEDMRSEDYLSNGWEAMTSAAIGYPIAVYRGGFILKDGDFVSLYGGVTPATEHWGSGYPTLSHGSRVPYRLEVTWISIAEDCEYEIDTEIDHRKIKEIFDRRAKRRVADMSIREERFREIIAGFAPGGVVVVWVATNAGTQYEIGRYQGKKVSIPQEEINRLDHSEKIWFDKAYRKKLLEREALVTEKWREKNQGKPIPYGKWDKYRQTYCYKPIITLPEGSEIYDINIRYYNGEKKKILFPEQLDSVHSDNVLPRYINVTWTTKEGEDKGALIIFNEEEVFREFGGFSPTDKLEMEFYVSKGDIATVYLHSEEKGISHKGLSVFPEERSVYTPTRKIKR